MTLLPLFRMYQPTLPPLVLARGCTSLTFMQIAQADVVVVEKLSDMDFVKSSNHMVPGHKCCSCCVFCGGKEALADLSNCLVYQ